MTKAQVYSYRDGLAVPIEAPPEEAASAPPFPHADALAVLKGLVDLLLDPKAARARIAEFADAVAKAGEAVSAVKKAEGDRDRVYAEIEEAKKRADEKHASELASHAVAIQRRELAVENRERQVAAREKEADNLLEQLKADRADLKRRLDLLKAASA